MKQRTPHSVLSAMFALGAAAIFLTMSTAAAQAAESALKLCARILIPSLFPYMVISSLIVSFGAADLLGGVFSPLCRVLRLPRCGAGAIVLGALCGFPVGAKTACELYRAGEISKKQTERLIAVANNTGPAFVIEVVGAHFWGSRGFGLTVYVAQILSALLVGVLYAHLSKKDGGEGEVFTNFLKVPEAEATDLLSRFSAAVSSAASAVIVVCGFVVFFAVAFALAAKLCEDKKWILAPLASFFEFTGGVYHSSRLGGAAGAFLSGFSVGFSSVSVFAQSKVFAAPLGVRLKPAAISKAVQGMLTGGAAALAYPFFRPTCVSVSACLPVGDVPTVLLSLEICLLVLFCLFPLLIQSGGRNLS